jgi:DNA-binding response OmpR family regulator
MNWRSEWLYPRTRVALFALLVNLGFAFVVDFPLSGRRRCHASHTSQSPHSTSLWLDGQSNKDRATKSPSSSQNGNSPESERGDSKWQDAGFVKRNAYWVVIVEDEEAIRQAVGDYLYDSGYQVSACDSARSFQELIRQQQQKSVKVETSPTSPADQDSQPPVAPGRLPDVIVSDIRMPDMDGIELLEWIRAHPSVRRLPVVMLTAKGLTADRIVGYRAGADFYLTKPFAPEELLGILDNCIVRRRQQLKAETGVLVDLQQDIAEIKSVLQQNAANTVLQTSVYLTPAEREVVTLLSRGYTNAEIASERKVATERIVKIMQKLYASTGTRTRTELVRWAVQTGYVPKR